MNGHIDWVKTQFCLLLLTLLFVFSVFATFKAVVWHMDSSIVAWMMGQAGAFGGAILLSMRPGSSQGRSTGNSTPPTVVNNAPPKP